MKPWWVTIGVRSWYLPLRGVFYSWWFDLSFFHNRDCSRWIQDRFWTIFIFFTVNNFLSDQPRQNPSFFGNQKKFIVFFYRWFFPWCDGNVLTSISFFKFQFLITAINHFIFNTRIGFLINLLHQPSVTCTALAVIRFALIYLDWRASIKMILKFKPKKTPQNGAFVLNISGD